MTSNYKALALLTLFLSACSAVKDRVPVNPEVIDVPVSENQVPGTVNNVWVERSYNQVQVPGQIDAEGVYYRPSHEAIVEIRQDRSQVAEYPADEREKELQYKTRGGR